MADQDIQKVFEAIKNQATLDDLRNIVQVFDTKITKIRNSDNLNVLQVAIVENHLELVQYLFMRNYFGEFDDTPKCNGYMHLAAQLDRVGILQVLLEHRPGDIVARSAVCYPDSCSCLDEAKLDEDGESEQIADSCTGMTPLDFAIGQENIKSLKVLLQSQLMNCSSESVLERACEINSPDALKILLTERPADVVLVNAFEQCVRKKLSACIDCLLEHKVPTENAFHGLNCFHVMYQYSSSYVYTPNNALTTASKEVGLLKSTSILVSHGFDVKACVPRNTYPLYTLLYMMFSDFCNEPDQEHVETIELLLKAGADPNFDEFLHRGDKKQSHIPVAYGRDSFSSALHAVQFDVFYPGATLNNTYSVLKLLFKYGANPYKKCSSSDQVPFATFLARFCDVDYDDYLIIQEDSPMEKGDVAKALGDVLAIYYLNMKLPEYSKAIVESGIKDKLEMFEIIGEITKDALGLLCEQPKSLSDCAKLTIWEALGRSALHFYLLQKDIPPVLLKSVRRLFE